jgi:hypothetical protein
MEDHVYRKARLGDRGSLNGRIGISRVVAKTYPRC